MPLLILCLFGQARADTGDQVATDGVDPPYLFLLMITFVITFFGVYFKSRNLIPSQESDTDSPHTICRPVDPLDLLPLSYRVRAVYPRCRNTNPRHRSTDTTETSLCSYPADPPFDPPATSFGGRNSDIAQYHHSPITPLLKKKENVPEMMAGNNLPHDHGSNENDEMTFARNLGREVEMRVPCGSCDSDSGSCDAFMYLYNVNVNVEPEEVAAMLEFTPNDEDDILDEEDHPSLFVGVSGYENSDNEKDDNGVISV